jgi:signal transduction histidine kinase
MDITNRKRAEQERLALSDRLATAQQGERRRISDELHKHLIQQLAGLAIDLGSMLMKPPVSSALLKKRLRSIQSGLVRAAEAARHAAHQLHPSELDDLGLAATLRGYCEDFSRREGIAVEFASRNLPEVSNREISSCLYNVVQESLRNVAQHANAKRASVTLDGAGGRIRLRVQDEGIGFPVQSLATTVGLGILRMKERVRLMNGSLTIESQPGGNTQITVEIQLPR